MDDYLETEEIKDEVETDDDVGVEEVIYYDIADAIIENVISPLVEYEIGGRLYSNVQQQIVELIKELGN